MTVSFVYTVPARRMIEEADERWITEHGITVDNPLLAEVDHAVELLCDYPQLGLVAQHRSRHPGEVRRMLLRSGWHLYYRFDAGRQLIEILALWFAARKSGPSL